jgi:hypothetical protein
MPRRPSNPIPNLSAISGALVAIIGALVAVVAVGDGSTGVMIGLVIGLFFLVVAVGIVIGLMTYAQRRRGR